jgi:hypothetical protein
MKSMDVSTSDEEKRIEMRKSMLSTLKTEGFHAIAALIEGEAEPGLINGSQPDIVAFNETGRGVVVQVETCNTVGTLEAEERLSSLIEVMADGHEFRLLVPTECMDRAEQWLKRLGLDSDVIWEYF